MRKETEFIISLKPASQSKSYEMGYDYGLNGPNETNCDFRLFGTAQNTAEWEHGKAQAELDKTKPTPRTAPRKPSAKPKRVAR